MPIPTTVAAFATDCTSLSNEEIYMLFEDNISQELRDEIYLTYSTDSSEPVREALNKIGVQYNVLSLINF